MIIFLWFGWSLHLLWHKTFQILASLRVEMLIPHDDVIHLFVRNHHRVEFSECLIVGVHQTKHVIAIPSDLFDEVAIQSKVLERADLA